MLRDLVRFYRQAPRDADLLTDETISLGDYLAAGRIWRRVPRRSPAADGERDLVGAAERDPVVSRRRPSSASTRNHGLLQLAQRPAWETVVGGSRAMSSG